MDKTRIGRAAGYALLGAAAITMGYYVQSMLIGGANSVRPMLFCILFVCIPLATGTWLVARSTPDAAERMRLVRAVLSVLFAFYLIALFAVLFFARIELAEYAAARAYYRDNIDLVTNFVPFETIRLYIRCLIYDYIGVGIPLDNLMGNVLLFMPMAVFLPCLFPAMRKFWRFLLLMGVILVAVEALQFLLCCGSCDVDDVILNLAGTLLVYGLLRIPAINGLLRRFGLWQTLPPDAGPAAETPVPTAAATPDSNANAADSAAQP